MAKAVLALFRGVDQARAAVSDLTRKGVRGDDISVVVGGSAGGAFPGFGMRPIEIPGFGLVRAGGPIAGVLAGGRNKPGGIAEVLRRAGIPDRDSDIYSQAVKGGGTLVVANVDDKFADDAADILDAYEPEDPDELANRLAQPEATEQPEVRVQASPRVEPAMTPVSAPPAVTEREDADDEERIRILEDELEIGTRQLDRGGVLVHREVSNIPIEEPVELAEERVEVERRAANRDATDAEYRAFEPGDMEFVETAEEVVVTKRPRVVEEIVIRKTRNIRREVVRDTVRKTEVKIEPRAKR
jgi:stress response protein YsnF